MPRPGAGICSEGLSSVDINQFLDLADGYLELNRQADKKRSTLRGRTIINCFFESSTPTRTSFELAGERLGGDVINTSVPTSSMVKGRVARWNIALLNTMGARVRVVAPVFLLSAGVSMMKIAAHLAFRSATRAIGWVSAGASPGGVKSSKYFLGGRVGHATAQPRLLNQFPLLPEREIAAIPSSVVDGDAMTLIARPFYGVLDGRA